MFDFFIHTRRGLEHHPEQLFHFTNEEIEVQVSYGLPRGYARGNHRTSLGL
jgi:hypothetical protein